MIITAITRKVPSGGGEASPTTTTIPIEFRVGEPVFAGGPTVKEIIYCRDGANKGEKGHFPSYLVKFEETDENRIIPESCVLDLAVVNESKKAGKENNNEATVELPE